jgi:BTB/POZ domain-containing protein KCTD9
MKGTSFRNAVLMSVTIKSDVKKVIFDGASMDKLTYALLKAVRQILIM